MKPEQQDQSVAQEAENESALEGELKTAPSKDEGDSIDSKGAFESEEEVAPKDPLEELKLLLEEEKNNKLRVFAELQNQQKRHVLLLERERKFGTEKLLKSLLPTLDNLESALMHAPKEEGNLNIQKWLEGVELTLKSFQEVLKKEGIVPISPLNEDFNPEAHEAVASVPTPGLLKDNQVIEVFQKGYKQHERILRPARVAVGRMVKNNDDEQSS